MTKDRCAWRRQPYRFMDIPSKYMTETMNDFFISMWIHSRMLVMPGESDDDKIWDECFFSRLSWKQTSSRHPLYNNVLAFESWTWSPTGVENCLLRPPPRPATNAKSLFDNMSNQILFNLKVNLISITNLTMRPLQLYDHVAHGSASQPAFLLV